MAILKRKHIRDVDKVKGPYVFAMGVAAGAGVLFFSATSKIWPTNRFDVETLFGLLLTGSLDPTARKAGLLAFLLLSGLIAFAYSFIFWSARRSGAWIGVQLGFIHAFTSGLMAGLLPVLHPITPGLMKPPGLFMMNFGFATVLTFFLAHLVYGTLVGQFFDWAALRDESQVPISIQRY